MMTRILKFFTIIMLLTCSVFGAPKEDNSQLQIKIQNSNGKAIPGILVYTDDKKGGDDIKSTTDSEGWVVFENCASFFLTRAERQAQKKRTTIHFEDPEGVYKHSTITMDPDWGASCRMGIRLSKKDTDKYATPEQMRNLAVTRGLNLRYFPACKSDFTNYPRQVTHQCVTEFKDTKVQMLEAEMLARIYLEKTYPADNINIQCKKKYRTKGGSDFLQCTSTDAKRAFEFEFRNLNTKTTNQTPDTSNIELNTAKALCKMRDGKYDFRDNAYPLCYKEGDIEGTEVMCRELNSDAGNFGWSTAVQQWGLARTCGFKFGTKNAETFEPRSYGSIDPYVFQYMEVQSTQDLILILNQYVRFKTRNGFDSFWCDSAPTRIVKNDVYSLDINWNYRNVLTCHLTTKEGQKHDLDFIFKDINQANQRKNAGDMAGMTCIVNGGNFDGKNCFAIDKDQCLALNTQLPGGTKFDEERGLCLMKDSASAEDLRSGERTAKLLGSTVVGVLITVGSGGSASEVAIAWVLTIISSTASVALEILNNIKNERARKFISDAQLCPYATTCTANGLCSTNCNPDSDCAKKTLLNAYADIESMATGQDTQDQLSQAVSYATETLVEKISSDCIDEDYKNKLKTATNGLEISIRTLKTASDVIDTIWFIQRLDRPFKSAIVLKFRNNVATTTFANLFGADTSGTNPISISSFAPTGSIDRLNRGGTDALVTQFTSDGAPAALEVLQFTSPAVSLIDKNLLHKQNELPNYIK